MSEHMTDEELVAIERLHKAGLTVSHHFPRILSELRALRAECASISAEFDLPPTMRPVEGEIRRMRQATLDVADVANAYKHERDEARECIRVLEVERDQAHAASIREGLEECERLRAELNVMQAAAQQVANTNKMLRAELAALKGDREKTSEYWELWER